MTLSRPFGGRARTRALLIASTAALAIIAPAAHAQCVVENDMMADASNPESGQTINCEDNLDSDGVVNRQANNVTVNINAPSGGISVTGQAGVALGDNSTVTVASGSNRPINTSGDNAPGIAVGNGAMITVGGQVTTSGGNSAAIEAGDDSTVNVDGTVRTGGGMSDAITVGANSTINVNEGARVATGNSNSAALVLGGDNSTINIAPDAVVTTSSGMSNPVLVMGNMGTVNVSGDVRSSSGNATAILLEGDMAMVTVEDGGFVTAQSSGSNGIESTGEGATIRVARGGEVRISSGNSSAIVSGTNGTVEIAGEVGASSSSSQGVVLNDGASLTIEEMGIISTSSSESQAVLVAEGASTATITVDTGGEIDAVGAQAILDRGMTDTTVTVDGVVFGGSSNPVIDLGAGNDTVTVNGTVEGSSASPVIDMGAGMDTLTINSSTTVTGPDILADLGEGEDTLNLNSGQDFETSRFRGAETINAGMNETMGDPNEGMSTNVTVDDDQSGTTVNNDGGTTNVDNGGSAMETNASGGGSTNINEGGSVMNANSSGSGSSTNVNSGGSADNTNASAGGSTNVNEGGSVMNASSDSGGSTNVNSGGSAMTTNAGSGGSTNVNSGGSVMNANSEGGTTTVNDGGSVMNSNATNGGSTTINSGGTSMNTTAGSGGSVMAMGDAGRVQSDAGGNVTVGNGGSASVDTRSGNGGNISFANGSSADVTAGASSRNQFREDQGFNFDGGSTITVNNSIFLSGVASANGGQEVGLAPDAFANGLGGQGVTNANSLAAGSGFDRIAQAGTDSAALDQLDGIVLANAADVPELFQAISNEGAVQAATGSLQAAGGFSDLLRAGTNPLSGSARLAGSPTRVAGPSYYSPRDDGSAGVWAAATYADLNVDSDTATDFDAQSVGYAAGVEGRIDLFGMDEAAIGVGVGYTFTDTNSASIDDGDVTSWSVGVYGGGTSGAIRTDASVAYTNSEIDIVGDDAGADIFTGRLELAADVFGDANQGVNLSPFVRAQGTLANYGDFAPAGPTQTVLTDGKLEQGVLGAGARLGYSSGGFGSNVRISAEAAYERVLGDRNLAFDAGVGNTANAFAVTQQVADKDRLHAGGQIGVEVSDTLDLGLRYDGRFGSDVTDHRGSARLTLRF